MVHGRTGCANVQKCGCADSKRFTLLTIHHSLLTTHHSQSDHLIPFDEIRFKDIMVSLLNIGIDQVDVVLRALKFKLMPVCL